MFIINLMQTYNHLLLPLPQGEGWGEGNLKHPMPQQHLHPTHLFHML